MKLDVGDLIVLNSDVEIFKLIDAHNEQFLFCSSKRKKYANFVSKLEKGSVGIYLGEKRFKEKKYDRKQWIIYNHLYKMFSFDGKTIAVDTKFVEIISSIGQESI